ncbi:MAG: hypothetical protein KGK07_17550, partial [Chloroflexota bacterium]|nr:hypothetical protein [Chloroflexota bacterium]
MTVAAAFGREMRLLACAAATCVLVLAAVTAPARAAVALPSGTATTAATASDMLLAQNQLRYAVGAPTIPADPRLVAAAQAHATYSALNNT